MTASPPSPQQPLDDLPHVQHFLELAAPLFLDRRELDERTWGDLRGLARQSGLSETELQQVVQSLQRRGVINEAVHGRPTESGNSLDPRAVPPPPPAPAPPPPPRAVQPAAHRWAAADERKLFSTFLDRARPILADRRGLDPTTYAILTDIAHSLGLTEQQFDEAIHLLCGSKSPPQPPAPPQNQSRAPAPQRDPKPDETFRKYLKLAIQDKHRSKGYLSESVERKLVDEGMRKLGLSPVYARHLIHEVAEQCGATVISQQDADSAEKDPQFDQFLARALPILAEQRGMTTRARLLLTTVAQETGISEDAIDRAVALLQRAALRGDTAQQWRAERREAFRNDLRRILTNTPGGMLPPSAVDDLLWRGQHLYGLDEDVARSLLVEVASACGVTALTPEQAKKCISALVQERLGSRSRLTADDEWQVFTYGEQLGLEEEQLRSIVRSCIDQGRRRRIRERNITSAILVLSGLAVVVVLGLFYTSLFGFQWPEWMTGKRSQTQPTGTAETGSANRSSSKDRSATAERDLPPSSETAVADARNQAALSSTDDDLEELTETARGRSNPGSSRSPASTSSKPVDWWDADLAVALVDARRHAPEARQDDLDLLEHGGAEERANAYQRLVAAAVDERGATSAPAFMGTLLIECAAKDPDEFASGHLISTLIGYLPRNIQPPTDIVQYDRTAAALRILIGAAESTSIAAERVSLIEERLSAQLGESLTAGGRRREFEAKCFAALARRQLQNLANAASGLEPAVVVAHAQALAPLATRYLPDKEREKLTLEVLVAGLATAGEQWRDYEPLFERVYSAEDPAIAMKLLEIFESTADVDLKSRIAQLLVPHLDIAEDEPVILDEIPERVRTSIGPVTPEKMSRDQSLVAYRNEAEEALRLFEADPGTADEEQLIQQIIRLSRLAGQGLALAREDIMAYQEFTGNSATLPPPEPARISAPPTLPGSYATQAEALIGIIRRTNKLDQRLRALDTLAGIVPMLEDIHPDQAETLAAYYVSDRSDTEHRERIGRLARFATWNNLRIALAHEIGGKSRYNFQLEEIVTQLSSEPLTAPNDAQWPRRARGHLLREALLHMSTAPAGEESTGLVQLEDEFRKNLLIQARIVGVNVDELLPKTEIKLEVKKRPQAAPAVILRSMAVVHANNLKTALTEPSPSKNLAELTHRIAAVDYLAGNDLQRTVYYDRVWAELVALQIDAETKNNQASEILKELKSTDAAAAGVLQQLRSSQAAQVRMWLVKLGRAG